MKEFRIHTMPIDSPEIGQKMIGGLKLSSCELAAKIDAAERSSDTNDIQIKIEESKIDNIPKWILDY